MIKIIDEDMNNLSGFGWGYITNFKFLMAKYLNNEVTMCIYLNFSFYMIDTILVLLHIF